MVIIDGVGFLAAGIYNGVVGIKKFKQSRRRAG